MIKRILLLLSAFLFCACANINEMPSDLSENFEGFGISLNKSIEANTVRLVPVKNGSIDEKAIYDVPEGSAKIFPINLYTDSSLTNLWNKASSSATILYYDSSTISYSKIKALYGTSRNINLARSVGTRGFDQLYIIGDFADTFTPMTQDSNGNFTYSFTYYDSYSAWGNGNGTMAFKFTSEDNYNNLVFGGKEIFELGTYYTAHNGKAQNIGITGLIHGEDYTITVINTYGTEVNFNITGPDLEQSNLVRNLSIRGLVTANDAGIWRFVELTMNDDGSYDYQFTYDSRLHNILEGYNKGDPYHNMVYFGLTPVNAYFLGNYSDVGEGSNELSTHTSSVGETRSAFFHYNDTYNFHYAGMVVGNTYNIHITMVTGTYIENSRFNVTLSKIN